MFILMFVFKINRFCRSGVEMIRQADIYLAEGTLERAYNIYMRFLT